MRPRRAWRSRAFVQPLLITVFGVVASVVLYVVVVGPTGCPSGATADTCGYYFMGGMGAAILTLPVLLVGLLITGFAVARSSLDPGLALRAVVLGILAAPLIAAIALVLPYTIASDKTDEIIPDVAGTVLVGLLVLIPVALGFGIGRSLRPSGVSDQASGSSSSDAELMQ